MNWWTFSKNPPMQGKSHHYSFHHLLQCMEDKISKPKTKNRSNNTTQCCIQKGLKFVYGAWHYLPFSIWTYLTLVTSQQVFTFPYHSLLCFKCRTYLSYHFLLCFKCMTYLSYHFLSCFKCRMYLSYHFLLCFKCMTYLSYHFLLCFKCMTYLSYHFFVCFKCMTYLLYHFLLCFKCMT